MRRFHIDHLNLRVRGDAGGDPKALAHAVAQALLHGLHRDVPTGAQQLDIGQITVPPVRTLKDLSAAHVRHEIAVQLARSVAAGVQRSSRSGKEK